MIQVLVFARLRDQLGEAVINLDMAAPARVHELRAALQQAYPSQADALNPGKALIAINQVLSHDEDAVITDQDEVALFPPMTGG
ncbi:MoaD/ThiS family protein [Oceanobacter mangrovi]|uniref:MoaD/ThiS family protein n=1 Tax=Oceanobacter mangrovi TaxID=2862510 RepID=UPI001C8DA269|nr:MoaD/ThiS family protein [Oceanobacter mangrovi]